jgi:hypothetical protein
VQDFTASRQSSLFFTEDGDPRTLSRAHPGEGMLQELLLMESRIDELAVMAFDIFMRCRRSCTI